MKRISLLIMMVLYSGLAFASQESQVKEGNASFAKQDWDGAVNHYLDALEQNGHGDILHYDLGTTLYKKGEYDKSIEHFKKANPKKDPELLSKISYNLGNALFKKGQGLEEKNIDEAIKSVQDSLDQFHKAQEINSKDADIQYNESQAKKELVRLQKKKEQQQQQQNQQNQKSDQNKQDQNKQNNSQQNNQKGSSQDKNQSEQKQSDSQKKDEQNKSGQEQKQQEDQPSNADKKSSDQQKQEQQQESAAQKEKRLEKEQAKEMLEEYEHSDAPKGLLNFSDKHRGDEHVDKDW